jgi:hypothetical protein
MFVYVAALLMVRLCSDGDSLVREHGAFGAMKTGRKNLPGAILSITNPYVLT